MIHENDMVDAVDARLSEDASLVTFDAEAVTPPANSGWAVFWVNGGPRSQDRVSGPSSKVTFTVTVHSVGRTRRQAAWVRGRVLDKLVDWAPVVDGVKFHAADHAVSLQTRSETDAANSLWFGVDQFDFVSL